MGRRETGAEPVKLTYIPCAAAGNVMADVCISTVASLIRITGHAKCDFILEDAVKMALDILARCREMGWTDRREANDERHDS